MRWNLEVGVTWFVRRVKMDLTLQEHVKTRGFLQLFVFTHFRCFSTFPQTLTSLPNLDLIDFPSQNRPKIDPTWTKNPWKINHKCKSDFDFVFYWFLSTLYVTDQRPKSLKLMKNHSFFHLFVNSKLYKSCYIHFQFPSHLGFILVPKINKKHFKKLWKSESIFQFIFFDFWSIWTPFSPGLGGLFVGSKWTAPSKNT